MKEEFNLSEKIRGEVCHGDLCTHDIDMILDIEKVKEFIKRLKEEINENAFGELININNRIIDKLAGEELSK